MWILFTFRGTKGNTNSTIRRQPNTLLLPIASSRRVFLEVRLVDTVLFDFGQKQRPLAQGAIPTMLISNLKSLGAVAGLLAGLALGTALAAVFSSAPIASRKITEADRVAGSGYAKATGCQQGLGGDAIEAGPPSTRRTR